MEERLLLQIEHAKQADAVQKHFEESLRLANFKRQQQQQQHQGQMQGPGLQQQQQQQQQQHPVSRAPMSNGHSMMNTPGHNKQGHPPSSMYQPGLLPVSSPSLPVKSSPKAVVQSNNSQSQREQQQQQHQHQQLQQREREQQQQRDQVHLQHFNSQSAAAAAATAHRQMEILGMPSHGWPPQGNHVHPAIAQMLAGKRPEEIQQMMSRMPLPPEVYAAVAREQYGLFFRPGYPPTTMAGPGHPQLKESLAQAAPLPPPVSGSGAKSNNSSVYGHMASGPPPNTQSAGQNHHYPANSGSNSSNVHAKHFGAANPSQGLASSRIPPPAHGGSIKRESSSPLVAISDRSLTPDSRGTPSSSSLSAASGLWRPPSLSPKPPHSSSSSRSSPHEAARQPAYEGRTSAPPAHQSSSPSPLSLPNRMSTPTAQLPAPVPHHVHNNVQSDCQPENLVVKAADKSGHRSHSSSTSRHSDGNNGSSSSSSSRSHQQLVMSGYPPQSRDSPVINGPSSRLVNGQHNLPPVNGVSSVHHPQSRPPPNSSGSVKPTFLSVANLISSPHGSHNGNLRSGSPGGVSSLHQHRPQATAAATYPPPGLVQPSSSMASPYGDHMTSVTGVVRATIAAPGHIVHTPSPPAAHGRPADLSTLENSHARNGTSSSSGQKRKHQHHHQTPSEMDLKRQRENEQRERDEMVRQSRNIYGHPGQPLPPPPGIFYHPHHGVDLNRLASESGGSFPVASRPPLPPPGAQFPGHPPSGHPGNHGGSLAPPNSAHGLLSSEAPLPQQRTPGHHQSHNPSSLQSASSASSLSFQQQQHQGHSSLSNHHHHPHQAQQPNSSNVTALNYASSAGSNTVNNSSSSGGSGRLDSLNSCDNLGSSSSSSSLPFAYKHQNTKEVGASVINSASNGDSSGSSSVLGGGSLNQRQHHSNQRSDSAPIDASARQSLVTIKSEANVDNSNSNSSINSGLLTPRDTHSSASSSPPVQASAAPNFKKKWLQNYSGDSNSNGSSHANSTTTDAKASVTPTMMAAAANSKLIMAQTPKIENGCSSSISASSSTSSSSVPQSQQQHQQAPGTMSNGFDAALVVKKEQEVPTGAVTSPAKSATNGNSSSSSVASTSPIDKKPVLPSTSIKVEKNSSETTENSGSDTDTGNDSKSPTKGGGGKKLKKEASAKKRPSPGPTKEKKAKKVKTEKVVDEEESPAKIKKEKKPKKEKKDKPPKKERAHHNRDQNNPNDEEDAGSGEASSTNGHSPKSPKVKVSGAKRGRKPKDKTASSVASVASDKPEKTTKSHEKKEKPIKITLTDLSGKKGDKIKKLKESGDRFLQFAKCSEIAPKLVKCRECEQITTRKSKDENHELGSGNIFCRFYEFRKLYYGKNGVIYSEGFSDPKDASDKDKKLWQVPLEPAPELTETVAKFMLTHVGDHFCDLVKQENEAKMMHVGPQKMAWKKMVPGIREMCDVCETTLFNIHWVCEKCGFVVCIDCYKSRKDKEAKEDDSDSEKETTGHGSDHGDKEKVSARRRQDKYKWLLCAKDKPHRQRDLIMTQIIAGTSLDDVSTMLHQVKDKYNIPSRCSCSTTLAATVASAAGALEPGQKANQINGVSPAHNGKNGKVLKENDPNAADVDKKEATVDQKVKKENSSETSSPLSMLAEVALGNSEKSNGSSTADIKLESEEQSQLRSLLEKPPAEEKGPKTIKLEEPVKFEPPLTVQRKEKKIWTHEDSNKKYPDINHSWFCGGRLLVLHDAVNLEKLELFQEQWSYNQPVIVTGIHTFLEPDLWVPNFFSKKYGDAKESRRFVNCRDDSTPKMATRKFWEGFENISKRPVDKDKSPMILKLKDFPPGDDFSDELPEHYRDLQSVMPIFSYTTVGIHGSYNLARRLPDAFVRPDLGPKLYVAYGPALPSKGTTNLHLDISDAVNVMCYVGMPKSGTPKEDDSKKSKEDGKNKNGKEDGKSKGKDKDEDKSATTCSKQEVWDALKEGGADQDQMKRCKDKKIGAGKVGAIWHIYDACDADRLREFLNKLSEEKKELESTEHSIHDQTWYLDSKLRKRLKDEENIEGYCIVQCLGDAVFIPAGAPHQVLNVNSCIKVAGDFVSPENIAHCFNLTEQFRKLTYAHLNREDKLQIKNIMYHAVKDALASLQTPTSPLYRPATTDEEDDQSAESD